MRKRTGPAFGFPVLRAIHPLKPSKNNLGRIGVVIYKATMTEIMCISAKCKIIVDALVLDTVLRIATAVSESPRLIVLNQHQMLPPSYAINIHCREPKDRARWKWSKERDGHLLGSPGSEVRISVYSLTRSDGTNCLSEQVSVKCTLALQKIQHT